eukprot:6390429-Amphidinium_carterae.5
MALLQLTFRGEGEHPFFYPPETRSRGEVARKLKRKELEMEGLMAEGKVLRQRLLESKARTGAGNLLSNCGLALEDIGDIAKKLEQEDYANLCYERQRKLTFTAPANLTLHAEHHYITRSVLQHETSAAPCALTKSVCIHREKLATAIFKLGMSHDSTYWRFIYATQKPLCLAVLRLELVDSSPVLAWHQSAKRWRSGKRIETWRKSSC